MKKIVLTFGLIGGLVSAALMFATMPFIDKIGFDKGHYVGYTGIVASFLLVFFGVRSYRENIGNGSISFGRAFSVGILITLITCFFYALSWQILSYTLMSDFMEKYGNYVREQAITSGASPQDLQLQQQQFEAFKKLYANPFLRFLITFVVEPLPVGLLVTLVSALILRKKPKLSKASDLSGVSPSTAAQS